MTTGSCLCGAVRYEIAGPFEMMAHCHCSMCRKHHGAMFATFTTAPLGGFRWVSGEDQIETYRSSENGRRGFCRHCGSVTPMIMKDMGLVAVPAGNLDDDPGVRPQMHMFAGSRAAWFPITGSLPQHAAYPPEFGGGKGISRLAPELRPDVTQGSCLCNETAWEFAGPPERIQNCHCSRCRRARSAAHATNAFFKQEQFTWVRGHENVRSHSLQGAKYFGQDFCGLCGSPVPRVVQATGYVVAPCGTFDSELPMQPLGNIFAASKAPWFEITNGLPQWDGYPPKK